MGLGVVCHWLVDQRKPRGGLVTVNALSEKTLQLSAFKAGKYSHDRILETYVGNARALRDLIIDHVVPSGIGCYRISSSLLPLSDVVPQSLVMHPRVIDALEAAGSAAREAGLRLTMHPGQFCVMSSADEGVRERAVAEIERHAQLLDIMGAPRSHCSPINIHGGAKGRGDELARTIDALSQSARARLTLENCETSYSVSELHKVSLKTGTPICLDSHHHTFRDGGISLEEAHEIAVSTWPKGIRPVQHLSNSSAHLGPASSFIERRKHSEFIHAFPRVQLEACNRGQIDIEIEAKAKNRAVLAAATQFAVALRS